MTDIFQMLREIICRLKHGVEKFKSHLMIIHHQLACKKSSDELLDACYNLVVTPPKKLNIPVITDNLHANLLLLPVQTHVLEMSGPLLAVLPNVSGISFDVLDKVLHFLGTLVEVGTAYKGKLLNMENLPESLLLTLHQALKESRYRSITVYNLNIDLCRSMLLMSDDLASKGMEIITKVFLLCQNSSGKIRYAAVDILGRILMNSLVTLLRAMMSVSNQVLVKSLSSIKIGKKRERALMLEEAEHRTLSLFADLTA